MYSIVLSSEEHYDVLKKELLNGNLNLQSMIVIYLVRRTLLYAIYNTVEKHKFGI